MSSALASGSPKAKPPLGTIGFESRLDYAAIGTVVNLAARLSDLANAGQILMTSEATGSLAGAIEAPTVGSVPGRGSRANGPGARRLGTGW